MPWKTEMVERLAKAVNGEKDRIIAEYAALTGKSTATLYRIAAKNGFASGRKTRVDKGTLKSGLTDDQIELIAGLVHATSRENKGGIMPVELAHKIAVDNGLIEPDAISPERLTAILRERELSKAALREATPHVSMRSLHPNHVHAVDVSVCIQFYLRNGKMRIMSEKAFYKNKPDAFAKVKTRLLRYMLVDHFSGAFYLQYFDTTGETAENLFNFLCAGWRLKADSRLPFHGVPLFLLQDAGSANISKPMSAFLDRLEIKRPENLPHNPRRQGCVEVMHNVVEQWFESRLRIEPANNVEQLNTWAMEFMIWFQASRNHTRTAETRSASWLRIQPEQLRILPDDAILRDLFAHPDEERTVDGQRTISFRGETYRLRHIEGLRPKQKVLVRLRPFDWPKVGIVFNDTEYVVDPVTMLPASQGGFASDAVVIGQEYKAQPETATQQAIKRLDQLAYGDDKKSVPFAGLKVFGVDDAKTANVATLPKRGTVMEISRGIVAKEIGRLEFFKLIRNANITLTPALNSELRAAFGESIDITLAEAVISALVEHRDWRQVEPARAAL